MNNMTMLALSLATGIVIDDAIVVLENIFRYVEEKKVSPREAASKATSEIGLAVMATTLSLVVIFLPVAFMTGQMGQYFLQLRHRFRCCIPDFHVHFLHPDAGSLRPLAEINGCQAQNLEITGFLRRPSIAPTEKCWAGVYVIATSSS